MHEMQVYRRTHLVIIHAGVNQSIRGKHATERKQSSWCRARSSGRRLNAVESV